MPRYKLTIAYDGTDFHGWQMQHPPEPGSDRALGEARPRLVMRTVQEEVQRAVREIVREPVIVQGASRTDAGVHAKGQVAAFTCSEGGRHEGTEARRHEGKGEGTEARRHEGGDGDGDGDGDGEVVAPVGGTRGCGGWPVERGVERLVRALNGRLPEDVIVLGAEPVAGDFQPISGATSKCYTYTIHSSPGRTLFDRRYVQHVWEELDVGAMNDAASRLVGEHDFVAFAAMGHGRLTTVRTVFSCRVHEVPPPPPPPPPPDGGEGSWIGAGVQMAESRFPTRRVVIEISGNGFLWNMVRIIAGTLIEVGRGRREAGSMGAILESRDRRRAGVTMPPGGLCLEWIRYGGSSER